MVKDGQVRILMRRMNREKTLATAAAKAGMTEKTARKTKKKPGRPPMNPEDRLSEIVTLRMNWADHEQLMRDARAAGLSVSAYLQECWRQTKQGRR